MTASKFRIATLAAASVGVAVAIGAVTPGVAGAATDPNALKVTYDAVGSSTVARTGSTVTLGPTVLNSVINPDGTFTGTLNLPPATTSFKAAGLLPTTATVSFIPAGPVTGTLGTNAAGTGLAVTSTASYYLKLSNVTVGGLPGLVGNYCQTILPVKISASSPASQPFNLFTGGPITGTYSIGLFANCGLQTPLIDLLIPGSGNTINLTLSNGRNTP